MYSVLCTVFALLCFFPFAFFCLLPVYRIFPFCKIAEAGMEGEISYMDAPDVGTAASTSIHHLDFSPMKGIFRIQYLFVLSRKVLEIIWSMVGSAEINIFEVSRSSTAVCCIFDTSNRACSSAFIV